MMTKEEIRRQMKVKRDSLSPEKQEKLNKKILDRLFQTEAYKKCEMIFSYMSFRSEVDTKEIIRLALLDGKKVYLPRVKKDTMDFYEIFHMNDLIISSYGIPEPQETQNLCYKTSATEQLEDNTKFQKLMLLPGLAFDLSGCRIGYGAGYYDRYLAANRASFFYKMALAYDIQVVDPIPSDKFDIKADAILTPTRLIDCNKE